MKVGFIIFAIVIGEYIAGYAQSSRLDSLLSAEKTYQNQVQKKSLLETFTPREQELLQAMARGYQSKEIAEKLSISVETVRTYIRRIYEKLQVHTRTEALNKVFPGNIS